MVDSPSSASRASDQETFGPSRRIAELNEIDQSIAVLLSSAAEAVEVLSNSTPTQGKAARVTLASAQDTFKNAASSYFSALSAIEVRLRRQVYALEEAGLIPPGDERDTRRGRAPGGDTTARTGGGSLDTSWLNAQADNRVEWAMKRELYEQAKEFVENEKSSEQKEGADD